MRGLFFVPLFLLALPQLVSAQDTAFNAHRGISIGVTQAAVREKLGKVKEEFSDEDDFDISETESMRVFYSPEKKVKAVVITFTGKLETAPAPNTVVGEKIDPKPDGGLFKMVQMPKKGYWVSYLKTGGNSPTVMITMQEMPKSSAN